MVDDEDAAGRDGLARGERVERGGHAAAARALASHHGCGVAGEVDHLVARVVELQELVALAPLHPRADEGLGRGSRRGLGWRADAEHVDKVLGAAAVELGDEPLRDDEVGRGGRGEQRIDVAAGDGVRQREAERRLRGLEEWEEHAGLAGRIRGRVRAVARVALAVCAELRADGERGDGARVHRVGGAAERAPGGDGTWAHEHHRERGARGHEVDQGLEVVAPRVLLVEVGRHRRAHLDRLRCEHREAIRLGHGDDGVGVGVGVGLDHGEGRLRLGRQVGAEEEGHVARRRRRIG